MSAFPDVGGLDVGAMGVIRSVVKSVAYRTVSIFADDSGNVPLRVMAGPCRGLRLDLDLIGRQEGAYLWGRYDRAILEQLSDVVRPGWTAWDCGTYLGFYTLFFSRAVGTTGQVVAIEPDPSNLDRTRRHCLKNGFDRVMYEQAAVGAPREEPVQFFVSGDTNSHLAGGYYAGAADEWQRKERDSQVIFVPCRSLDQLLVDRKLPVPNLVKLDIEGAEKDAFDHVTAMCRTVRPHLVVELHNRDCDQAAWRFSQAFDYRLHSLDTGRVVDTPDASRGTLLCVPV